MAEWDGLEPLNGSKGVRSFISQWVGWGYNAP